MRSAGPTSGWLLVSLSVNSSSEAPSHCREYSPSSGMAGANGALIQLAQSDGLGAVPISP